jgi:hypothetical protein
MSSRIQVKSEAQGRRGLETQLGVIIMQILVAAVKRVEQSGKGIRGRDWNSSLKA